MSIRNIIRGDIDQDGVVEADDALRIERAYVDALAGKDPGITDLQKNISDVTCDGQVDASDAQYTLQYYVDSLALVGTDWDDLLYLDRKQPIETVESLLQDNE